MMSSGDWSWMIGGAWQTMSRQDWQRLQRQLLGNSIGSAHSGWSAWAIAGIALPAIFLGAAIALEGSDRPWASGRSERSLRASDAAPSLPHRYTLNRVSRRSGSVNLPLAPQAGLPFPGRERRAVATGPSSVGGTGCGEA
jgi:hypothetical protein